MVRGKFADQLMATANASALMDTVRVNCDSTFGQGMHLGDLLDRSSVYSAFNALQAIQIRRPPPRGVVHGLRIVNKNSSTLDAFWLTLHQTTNLTGSGYPRSSGGDL